MASTGTPRWLALESNPAVLSDYIHKLGASPEWCLIDVYGLDDGLLSMIPEPVSALLLLFPLPKDEGENHNVSGDIEDAAANNVFFMKQTIGNACGAIGLLHALANSKVSVEKGSPLDKFLRACKDKTPEEKAKLLEASEDIHKIHDSFARQGQTTTPGLQESVDLHFVAIVLGNGHVYELDGRRAGPVRHMASTEKQFLRHAADVCKKYMEAMPNTLNFSLAALVQQ